MSRTRQRLVFINPWIHFVYDGWIHLFDSFFELTVYSGGANNKEILKNSRFLHLPYGRAIRWSTNFINWYKATDILYTSSDILVIGDIFCTNLGLSLRGRNIIYYSEFFDRKKPMWKRLTAAAVVFLFFRHKKILAPTPLAF